MIPFNKPYYSGKEKAFIAKAMETKTLTGDMKMIRDCESFLEHKYGFKKVFLTNSCTMALEMAAVIAGIGPGDEVILPSYTFVSTANAFALRGAKLVFADSRKDHPNLDEQIVEKLITEKTKAIVLVHYAGVSCDFSVLKALSEKYGLLLIEDAAQCIDAHYNGQPLGTLGDIACFSFHETKNIHCGEGGFIAINNETFFEKTEVVRNKGTNRSAFSRGLVDKYEWVDLGFSSIPSSIAAAFLYSQLEKIDKVQKRRLKLWKNYYKKLKPLQKEGMIRVPVLPKYADNNAHIFYILCNSEEERSELIQHLENSGAQAVFHYQSLHSSPYYTSKHDGRALVNSDKYSRCLLRLPLFYDLRTEEQELICNSITDFYSERNVRN